MKSVNFTNQNDITGGLMENKRTVLIRDSFFFKSENELRIINA